MHFVNRLFLVPLLLLAGCASSGFDEDSDPKAKDVVIVDAMTGSDSLRFHFVGKISATGYTERSTEQELKNQAAKVGATVIRITSKRPSACDVLIAVAKPEQQRCLAWEADAFAPKTEPAVPATPKPRKPVRH